MVALEAAAAAGKPKARPVLFALCRHVGFRV